MCQTTTAIVALPMNVMFQFPQKQSCILYFSQHQLSSSTKIGDEFNEKDSLPSLEIAIRCSRSQQKAPKFQILPGGKRPQTPLAGHCAFGTRTSALDPYPYMSMLPLLKVLDPPLAYMLGFSVPHNSTSQPAEKLQWPALSPQSQAGLYTYSNGKWHTHACATSTSHQRKL